MNLEHNCMYIDYTSQRVYSCMSLFLICTCWFLSVDIEYKECNELLHSITSPSTFQADTPSQIHTHNKKSHFGGFGRHYVEDSPKVNVHGVLIGAHNTRMTPVTTKATLPSTDKPSPHNIRKCTPSSIAKSSPHIGGTMGADLSVSVYDSIRRSHSNRDSLHSHKHMTCDMESRQPNRKTVNDCESLSHKLSYELGSPREGGDISSLNGSHSFMVHTPPTQKHPPPKDIHSDMYNTAFALQSLNSIDTGYPVSTPSSDYMSRVRDLWDGHMSVQEEKTPRRNPMYLECEKTNGVHNAGILMHVLSYLHGLHMVM